MDEFKLRDIKGIHVANVPVAKMGIIDSLNGEDAHKNDIKEDDMLSYKTGHEIGTEIENMLKGDQRPY